MRTIALVLLLPGCSCGDSAPVADDGADADADTDADADADADADGGGWDGGVECVVTPCQDFQYQCGDCVDNDGDGRTDYEDPDCLNPCDNTEDGYDLGIPGKNEGLCRMDCYYDHDSGEGNDDCLWNHDCDPWQDNDPPYPQSDCIPLVGPARDRECPDVQSEACHDFCGPLTPNGCDCFGCCEIDPGSGRFVWLGSRDYATDQLSCYPDTLEDDEACHPCTPVGDCFNDCGECEICFGREDLPPGCDPDDGEARCPAGGQPCGEAGDEPCPADFFCITGCCQPKIF
jgi:hypothetical protein